MEPSIDFQPVKSSNIESIGHCPATNTLGVKFKHGGTYHFKNFPAEEFQAMKGSKSVGKHFHTAIRGKFDSVKVGTE